LNGTAAGAAAITVIAAPFVSSATAQRTSILF
jgi:hypothetical protein